MFRAKLIDKPLSNLYPRNITPLWGAVIPKSVQRTVQALKTFSGRLVASVSTIICKSDVDNTQISARRGLIQLWVYICLPSATFCFIICPWFRFGEQTESSSTTTNLESQR